MEAFPLRRLALAPLLLLLAAPLPALAAEAPAPDDLLAQARAARDAPAGEGAVTMGWPRDGDQGRFERTASDARPLEVTFAWRPARFVDEWGRAVEGAEVAYADGSGSGCSLSVTSPAGDATTTSRTPLDLFARYAGEARPVAVARPWSCFSGAYVREEGLTLGSQRATLVAYDAWPATLCLFRSGLQGARVAAGAPVAPLCPAWGEGEWFAGAVETRRGFAALPVYHLSSDGASVSRAWLVDGLAYPLEVERRVLQDGKVHERRHQLVALATAGDPLASGPRDAPPPLALRAPDRLLGPPDEDARLPLRLSDAARAATGDPTLRGLQAILADPQAALAGAALRASEPAGAGAAPAPTWTLVYAAPGKPPAAVECAGEPGPLGPLVRCREAGVSAQDPRIGAVPSTFGAAALPARVASFADALARWEAQDANASAAPVRQALYRPWGAEDLPPALEIGTRPADRPDAVSAAAPPRAESLARLDPATGRSSRLVTTYGAPFHVSNLPAGIEAPALLAPAPPPAPALRAPLLVAAGVAAAGALVALVVLWAAVKAGLVSLYTRLVRANVLDSEVRARIHALVAEEPGIHAGAIVERLGRGNGLGEYHLGVLVREGFLACVETTGFRRYFVAGRFPPAEMRARAVLREGHAEALFRLIRQEPGIQLGPLAQRAGLSLPQASRTVKRLAEAGLVERAKVGRVVRLRVAKDAPGDGGPVPTEP